MSDSEQLFQVVYLTFKPANTSTLMRNNIAQFNTLKDSAAKDPLRRPFHGLFRSQPLSLYKHRRGETGRAKLFHLRDSNGGTNRHKQREPARWINETKFVSKPQFGLLSALLARLERADSRSNLVKQWKMSLVPTSQDKAPYSATEL